MPSTITHDYHYKDVYPKTNDKFKNKYSFDNYATYSAFAQGHDTFFFLDFWNLLKIGRNRAIVYYLQDHNFQEIILKLIEASYEHNTTDLKEFRLMIYGYIMHQILDAYAHPYIIYESEAENLHNEVESYIDKYFIETREKANASLYPVHKLVPNLPEIASELKKTMNEAFEYVYNYKNIGDEYIRALRQMQAFLYLFRYDPTGIKKLGYNLIDKMHVTPIHFSWLSYKCEYANYLNYLNENKEIWMNPVDNKLISNQTFMEIYDETTQIAGKMISELDEALDDKANMKDYANIVPNISAVHGKSCNQNKKIIYIKK